MSYDIGYKDGTNAGYDLAIDDLERLIIGFKDVDIDAFNKTVDTLGES